MRAREGGARWAATEARLVSARHTETGERARGMSRILYRGPETGDWRRVVRLELVGGKSTGVRVRGNLIPRRTCWRTRMDKEGEKERGGQVYFNRLGDAEPKAKPLQKAICSSKDYRGVDGRRTLLERPKRRVGSG